MASISLRLEMPAGTDGQTDDVVNIVLTQALAGLLAGLLGWVEQLWVANQSMNIRKYGDTDPLWRIKDACVVSMLKTGPNRTGCYCKADPWVEALGEAWVNIIMGEERLPFSG